MNGTPFKLGTFAKQGGGAFAAIVLGDDDVINLKAAPNAAALSSTDSIDGLLEDWDANFAVLQRISDALQKEGRRGAVKLGSVRPLPPVRRPGKMFYAALNFQDHVDEMLRAGMTPAGGPRFTGEKSTSDPYLFLKAPSTLAGAYDNIEIPTGLKKIDWEAEIALAIGKRGKRIKAERALDYVAGFMTTNDVSARDLQIRADRPGLRSDWLNGKSHDNFAQMGPFLVPRAFVPDHKICSFGSRSTAKSGRTATPRNSSSHPKSRSTTPRTFSRSSPGIFSAAARAAASVRARTRFLKLAT